ncbi:hypothetical protein ElyMa_000694600 [Elysia marginata]|uniref:Uncharacterized protein n=1 Tax=Elysia marginata TaxID=1093978 RepID=A0AAV4GK14_9GAST|nr:hypothetical protein ElyMa_000694600 [Elysia marginata]
MRKRLYNDRQSLKWCRLITTNRSPNLAELQFADASSELEPPSQDEKLDSVGHTALEFSRVVDFDDSARCYAATVAEESSGAFGKCIQTPCTNQEKK